MASASFLFVVRVPFEEGDGARSGDRAKRESAGAKKSEDTNDKAVSDRAEDTTPDEQVRNVNTDDKKDDEPTNVLPSTPGPQVVTNEGSDTGTPSVQDAPVSPQASQNSYSPDTLSSQSQDLPHQQSPDPQKASHSSPPQSSGQSIPIQDSDISPPETATSSQAQVSESGSPSQQSDQSSVTTPLQPDSVSADERDAVTPPPWDFTPPSSPTTTSPPQDVTLSRSEDAKVLPSSAWTFPPTTDITDPSSTPSSDPSSVASHELVSQQSTETSPSQSFEKSASLSIPLSNSSPAEDSSSPDMSDPASEDTPGNDIVTGDKSSENTEGHCDDKPTIPGQDHSEVTKDTSRTENPAETESGTDKSDSPQILGEETPGEKSNKETPGEKSNKETPGEKTNEETPGEKTNEETPGEKTNKETPGEKSNKETPGEKSNKETPGEKTNEETPGEKTNEETPGEKSNKETPGEKTNEETPGEKTNEETPGEKSNEETPGEKTNEETPGEKSNEETPGEKSNKETPGEKLSKDSPREAPSSSGTDIDIADDKDMEIFVKKESMFKKTLNVLETCCVKNLSVHKTTNGKSFQFVFVEEDENCEELLNKLAEIGVGDNAQSSISMFETSVYMGTGGVEEKQVDEFSQESAEYPDEQKQSEFKKSIKARMLVTEVVKSVEGNAEFTFDFLLLVLLASSISAMGLVENSSVVLVASMLVSPIMGPILAGTFGTVIQNHTLRNLGIKNEIISLLICVVMGLLWGLVCGGVCHDGAAWGSTDAWPTSEMKSRGLTRSLWAGVLIAVPSGAGVALSILGGNTGSLVGVAISASLLPPAVNAGMLWASAVIAAIAPPSRVAMQTVLPTISNITQSNNTSTQQNSSMSLPASVAMTPGLDCVPFMGNAYVPVYSCNMAEEMLVLGLFSLLLTILNIICIIIMGILVLKIKEVAPQTALSEDTKTFWHEDIKIAKESYATMKGNQSKNLSQEARTLLNEWRKENGDQPIQLLQLERMTQEIDNDPGVHEIQMRIPGGARGDMVSRHFASHFIKDDEDFDVPLTPQYKTFHSFHGTYSHHWRSQWRNSFHGSHQPSSGSGSSLRRKKRVSTSLTEINEENVPYSAGGPMKQKRGKFSKAFGILRHPKAGKSKLFRRRQNESASPKEKHIRFAVEKVPDEEVKVRITNGTENQDVTVPLLEKRESV